MKTYGDTAATQARTRFYSALSLLMVPLLAATVLVGCGGGGSGSSGGVTVPPSLPPDNWVTNGTALATALSADGNTLYIGGSFTLVGPNTGAFVAIDAASGVAASTFPRVGGAVNASAPDGAGGWYIGGSFTRVGISARQNIAHVLANGSVDPAFNPFADSAVLTLAVSGSRVYAGGAFSSIGGQARRSIGFLAP